MADRHPVLHEPAIDALREQLLQADPDQPVAPSPPTRPVDTRQRLKHAARRGLDRSLGRYVSVRTNEVVDRAVSDRVDPVVQHLSGRIDALPANDERVHALAVNLELIKGELRGLQHTLDELGLAIAPASGLPAASARMAELRERLLAVERRVRDLPTALALAPTPTPSPPELGVLLGAQQQETHREREGEREAGAGRFDYRGFERRFRGDPDVVLDTLRERYLGLLRGRGPVLDVGCGRGELLHVLADEGVEARGVDLEPEMVAEARARGLDVHLGDAVAYLRGLPAASLGAIVSFHVVEHLDLDALLELLELSASRLRPGGVFVAETPNPASLIVLGNSYVLDPTHVRPLHPLLMAFLCEGAGFREIEIRHFAPATDYQLALVDAPDAPDWVAQVNAAFTKLNDVLFGPQEYAVVATTPA